MPPELAAHWEHLRDIADQRRAERDQAREIARDALYEAAEKAAPAAGKKKRNLADYYLHVPSGKFIHAPSGSLINAETLNRMFEKVNELQPATAVARSMNVVDDMTWSPSDPQFIHGSVLERDGWVEQEGAIVYNLYRAPKFKKRAGDAKPFLDLVEYLFPNDWQHVVAFLAFVAQNPGKKINHALVLGSDARKKVRLVL
jgi:hypothetical protein